MNVRRSIRTQRGLAVVELALATPFLLVMLLAGAEFTRAFYEFNTLTKGVRDAARFAAENAYSSTNQFQLSAQKISQAQNIVVFGNVNGAGAPVLNGLSVGNVSVVQRDLGAAPLSREHIQVTASYNYQPLTPVLPGAGFLPQSFGLNFLLVSQSTMRAL